MGNSTEALPPARYPGAPRGARRGRRLRQRGADQAGEREGHL